MTDKTKFIDIPPHQLVREFFDMPLPGGSLDVLDAGCHTGRNSRLAAKLGHSVVGLSIDSTEVSEANQGNDLPNLSYVVGDILKLPFQKQFDVILLNEVIQDIKIEDRRLALRAVQRQTAIGGYNIVSAYAGAREQAVDCFELYDAYRISGWRIVSSRTDEEQVRTDTNELLSKASIIAHRDHE